MEAPLVARPTQAREMLGLRSLAVLGGKWKPLILYDLAHDTWRYGALRRCLPGVSDKALIKHLKELDADGIVERFDDKEIPPRIDCSLTQFGMTLAQSLVSLCVWGEAHSEDGAAIVERRSARTGLSPVALYIGRG
jgi:DNA-binding HxlR family transcriptional regulator